MSTYATPLQDMLFTMQEVGRLDEVCAYRGNEDMTPDVVMAIMEEASRFAREVLDPLNRIGDVQGAKWREGRVFAADGFCEAYESFCANGWNGMPAPVEWGGQGLPTLVSTAVLEMWKSSNMAFSLCQMLTMGAVEAISHHGSAALKSRFLAPLIEGRWTGTMNLTEPQAGSDLSALASRAVPEDDHYRISGSKIFITWGEHDLAENIVHLVLARLPEAPPGVKGISLFLCPKFLVNSDGSLGAKNDLVCTSIEHKMGIHASPTASMTFGEADGAIGYLVGEPNEGLACMFTMMNHARLNVGLEGVGISERAYQHARAYALERQQGRPSLEGSSTIAGHPDVRRMLMDMKARIEAMRALAYFCAGLMDQSKGSIDANERLSAGALVDLLTPVVKGWCTDSALQITSDGIQVHGGMGYVEETGAAQYLRDSRITTIYEGTTGIQANDLIRRKLARDNGATMKALIHRMRQDARRMNQRENEMLSQIGMRLQAAISALREALDWVLDNQTDFSRCAAGAVPFLRLSGTVIGGWLSARLGEAALTKLEQGADAVFMSAKLVTAGHYAAHFLGEAFHQRDIVLKGADSTLALADEQL
ncbi:MULTISPECIES: acyl-CoA dehydrogenase [Caballeronia]|uniref:acyl-CoA dehydrogenase n=1 Tax=Caballeronia TaxID=1827195 RepID=UPI001FD4AF7C|nr:MULTISPECIES: acyl-CoA dehydrogenase [Caballeronia]MDR5799159.1 acyl-CoA dehydrogenase [Caballeronia sp. LZ001]